MYTQGEFREFAYTVTGAGKLEICRAVHQKAFGQELMLQT